MFCVLGAISGFIKKVSPFFIKKFNISYRLKKTHNLLYDIFISISKNLAKYQSSKTNI